MDPVCSSPIFDAKAKKELQIMEMSDSQAPAQGGKKLLLFCEKVTREDIKVGLLLMRLKTELLSTPAGPVLRLRRLGGLGRLQSGGCPQAVRHLLPLPPL